MAIEKLIVSLKIKHNENRIIGKFVYHIQRKIKLVQAFFENQPDLKFAMIIISEDDLVSIERVRDPQVIANIIEALKKEEEKKKADMGEKKEKDINRQERNVNRQGKDSKQEMLSSKKVMECTVEDSVKSSIDDQFNSKQNSVLKVANANKLSKKPVDSPEGITKCDKNNPCKTSDIPTDSQICTLNSEISNEKVLDHKEDCSTSVSSDLDNWNQFEANKKLFNIEPRYEEGQYTIVIDRKAKEYKNRLEKAKVLASEILATPTTDLHRLEERGMFFRADDGKYSTVVSKKADANEKKCELVFELEDPLRRKKEPNSARKDRSTESKKNHNKEVKLNNRASSMEHKFSSGRLNESWAKTEKPIDTKPQAPESKSKVNLVVSHKSLKPVLTSSEESIDASSCSLTKSFGFDVKFGSITEAGEKHLTNAQVSNFPINTHAKIDSSSVNASIQTGNMSNQATRPTTAGKASLANKSPVSNKLTIGANQYYKQKGKSNEHSNGVKKVGDMKGEKIQNAYYSKNYEHSKDRKSHIKSADNGSKYKGKDYERKLYNVPPDVPCKKPMFLTKSSYTTSNKSVTSFGENKEYKPVHKLQDTIVKSFSGATTAPKRWGDGGDCMELGQQLHLQSLKKHEPIIYFNRKNVV